jgi:hypothetical protein
MKRGAPKSPLAGETPSRASRLTSGVPEPPAGIKRATHKRVRFFAIQVEVAHGAIQGEKDFVSG